MRHHQGFTLIELLVVMIIISLVIAAATFTLGDNQAVRLQQKSEQLVALIDFAKEQAIFNSEDLGLVFNKNSYAFYRLDYENVDETSWLPIQGDAILKQRELPDGLEFELYLEGIKVLFKKEEEITPQVFILSDGSVSPFQVNITDNINHAHHIKVMQNGEYELLAVN